MPASFAATTDAPSSEKSLQHNDFSTLKCYVYFLMSFSSVFGQLFVDINALKIEPFAPKQFIPPFDNSAFPDAVVAAFGFPG